MATVDNIAALRSHPVEVRNDWHNATQREPLDILPVVARVRTSDYYRIAYRITWPHEMGVYDAYSLSELGHALVAAGYREYLWDATRYGGGFRRFIVP